MQPTRQAILDFLRRHHQASVKSLSHHLRLTATAVRQHVAILERDGLVESHVERGRVGRPAVVFTLTPAGDDIYPKLYDDLANAVISEARELFGIEAQQRLLKNVASRFSRRYASRIDGQSRTERLETTARIIADRGNVVDAEWSDGDYLIHKHTCPFWNVARENSAVCALDVEFVRQLAGADARLSSSLLRGDEACTFRIRPRSA